MTPTLPDWVRPMIARALGAVVAGLAAGIAKRYGYDVSAEEQRHLVDWGATLAVTGVLFVYGAAHRALSARVNPSDAASPVLSSVATGPMGSGERTRLAERLDAAAEVVAAPMVPTSPVKVPRPSFAPVEPPRPAYEPLMSVPEVNADIGPRTVFGDAAIVPPPRERRKRAPRVTVQEAGAPQPETVSEEPTAGFEP
jgi:hypothetical protein